jgi:hypothetical protein
VTQVMAIMLLFMAAVCVAPARSSGSRALKTGTLTKPTITSSSFGDFTFKIDPKASVDKNNTIQDMLGEVRKCTSLADCTGLSLPSKASTECNEIVCAPSAGSGDSSACVPDPKVGEPCTVPCQGSICVETDGLGVCQAPAGGKRPDSPVMRAGHQ